MKIVPARPEDADILSGIAREAKRSWGYPEKWITHWAGALTISAEYLRVQPAEVAVLGEEIVGFYALQFDGAVAILDHLWVLPPVMGQGIGRGLFSAAEKRARAAGADSLRIIADPYAEGFYRRMGASVYGREPAPMDGKDRFLPLMEKKFA